MDLLPLLVAAFVSDLIANIVILRYGVTQEESPRTMES